MDRRPLLSSSREASRRPAPQPLLPPSQVDASLIVFEDDVDGTSNGAGPASDARHSIFSSLSLSGWSENSTAATPPSYLSAVLFRPFQRLRFWCGDGDGGRCAGCPPPLSWCCCCRRRRRGSPSSASRGGADGPHDSGNDVFYSETGDAVAADALRASGASQQGKVNNVAAANTATSTATSPHHGASSGSRQHRQYAPPRSHAGGVNILSLSPPLDAAGAAQESAEGAPGDSIGESSLAGSSTPPSSTARGRIVHTAPGEQLVMHRGVLMRMAPDGSCTRVEDTAATGGGFALQDGAGQQHLYVPRTGSLEETQEGVVRADASESIVTGYNAGAEDTPNPYALSMAMHALETSRRPLRSLEQLSTALTAFAPYLPLRVESEVDVNSASALPAAGAYASPTSPTLPAVPLCLHVLGPVQACPTATALRLLEDVLLEDCDHGRLCMNALHCADLDVRGVAAGSDDATGLSNTRAGRLGGPEEGRHRAQSNAFLDLLLSPVVAEARASSSGADQHGTHGGQMATASPSSREALTAAAASTHVLTFLNTIIKGRGPQLTTMHFTRCFVAPHDMARFVPLPLSTLRRLRYEQCALTPAHIDALLTLARHQDAERRNGAREAVSFGVLEELQLSGPLTIECVSELLDFVEEQQLQTTGGSGAAVALHQVILPSGLVRAAKEHPFVRANYQRLSVVSAQ